MSERKTGRVALDLRGLAGREELFRLSGAVQRSRAVNAWFEAGPAELRTIAREWFTALRDCGDDVRELLHDGCPTACVEDVAFAYVNTFKSHVNVGFYYGAQLDDPAGLLQGSGKRMRHVKLVPGEKIDSAALRALIEAAYAHVTAGIAAERKARGLMA
jgi:hypothetical protein